MCGFLTEFCFDNNKITEKQNFADVLALSKHRGPDNTSIISKNNFQLGFNRLSILDLSSLGNQPKQSPSGRYHVVCNGELYNYKDLEKQYDIKNLSSTSDTEVLVHLCDLIGVEKTIKSLNGMFAITIIDTETDSLFLTRDFAGIKPLFYGIHEHGVVGASQFDQIYKHPWFLSELKLRKDIIKEYFGYGYMQAPNTIYKSIFQINPGELLHIDRHGQMEKKSITTFGKKPEQYEERKLSLDQVLKNAVNSQLVSDVPVATFLSGGIDSPLVSAYAKKGKQDIEAFTLKVNHPTLNESEIAKSYAEHLNLKQHIVSVESSDILESIDEHFKAYSEPFGDYSSIPTYVISREAKKNHTVMLSGDGGDELFFGYPRMRDVLDKKGWFKLPYLIRILLVKVTNRLGFTNTWAPYFKNLNAFISNKHLQIPAVILDKAMPNISFSKAILNLYSFHNGSRKNLLIELRWNEFYAHMQRILIKVDRASMAHSLEVRVPLLDKESIKSAWQLSSTLDSKKELKKELKQLLAIEVPESLINKKKMGFSVPLYDWFHNDLKDDVKLHIFETPFYGQEVIDVDVLKKYVQDFFDKKHNNAWGVWHIYAWQKWAKIHLR